MPSQVSYDRLSSTPLLHSDSTFENLEYEDQDTAELGRNQRRTDGLALSETTAWKFFKATCIIALAVSAANLSYLSASQTFQAVRTHLSNAQNSQSDLKRPSVYLGLENVPKDPSLCRSRSTFPQRFSTYDARQGSNAVLQHLHAPDDKMTLVFGGSTRAVVDTYIPDYGLENCTLSLRRIATDSNGDIGPPSLSIEVYLLPSANVADRAHASYLDTLSYKPGIESTSIPFFCPSRGHVFFEWRCTQDVCKDQIVIPLEGVTQLSEYLSALKSAVVRQGPAKLMSFALTAASAASLGKTGFRVIQYEALHCVPN